MAETHTKTGGPCLCPVHISFVYGPTALTSGWLVVCQNTGPIVQPPASVPAPQLFLATNFAGARAAADSWLTTVGAI